jgi:hypothetical protein
MEEENRKTFVHFDFFEDLTADIPAEPCRGMEDIGERICQLREEKGEMGTSMFLSLYSLSNQTDFLFLFVRPALIADSPPVD